MVTDDWLKRLVDPSRDICIPQPPTGYTATANSKPHAGLFYRLTAPQIG